MFEKFHVWLIKLVVGRKPVVMNCVINGKGIKKGWVFASWGDGDLLKSIVTPIE